MTLKTAFLGAAAALMLATGGGDPARAGAQDVVAEDAWARASIGTSRPGVAYMTLRNAGDDPVTLTGLASDLAMMPMLHKTTTDASGTSTMTHVGELAIAPGQSVALEPGGLHVMLMNLRRPMIEGESFSLTLIFSDGGEMRVEVPILGLTARGPEG